MKICLQPWKQLHIHLSGNVWFCCMKPSRTQKIDMENMDKINLMDMINCDEVVKLREAFINEKVPAFCKGCMMLHDYDSIEEFKETLIKEECSIDPECDVEQLKYLKGTREVFFEFTTKCNFKCIYCLHSTSAFSNRIKTIEVEKFYQILNELVSQLGITELSTTGIGEFTLIPYWTNIVNTIVEKYPQIQLTMFSNFGRKLSDFEIETMTKLKNVNVSMDTNDKELFKLLRSGDVDVVVDNLKRLKMAIENNETKTTITIASVVNDKVFYNMDELLEFLINEKLCDAMTLTPMTLPKVACTALDIYPIKAEEGTAEYTKIKDTLKNIYEKGKKANIGITWSGDLQDFIKFNT